MTFHQKAKKPGLKSYDFHMGMFDYTVRLVIGDHKKCIELMNWFHEGDAWYDDGHEPKGQLFHHQTKCPVMWLPRVPRTIGEQATLAHESAHAVTRLFMWAGIPHDTSTDEVYAHGVSFLYESIRKRLR